MMQKHKPINKENVNKFDYIITSVRYYEQCEKKKEIKNYNKCVMHITIQVFVSWIYKEFLQINDKKKANPIEK